MVLRRSALVIRGNCGGKNVFDGDAAGQRDHHRLYRDFTQPAHNSEKPKGFLKQIEAPAPILHGKRITVDIVDNDGGDGSLHLSATDLRGYYHAISVQIVHRSMPDPQICSYRDQLQRFSRQIAVRCWASIVLGSCCHTQLGLQKNRLSKLFFF